MCLRFLKNIVIIKFKTGLFFLLDFLCFTRFAYAFKADSHSDNIGYGGNRGYNKNDFEEG